MEICQNLPFASNTRNPFPRAFDYLRLVMEISNQFSDERGGLFMLCEDQNTI